MNAADIAETLLDWFTTTDRKLPWRSTYNPYHIWVSEIMLQQTQMERGVAYFNRWVSRFPDVPSVAIAPEQEILKYWEGLGYYARARNLHKAAKRMVADHDGQVPDDYSTLLELPGIGPYTAAAISSIAGNFDIPVIDANVCRVYSRILDIDSPIKSTTAQQQVKEFAVRILPTGRARRYNQAVMDLGGLICTPKKPKCPSCPVRKWCKAFEAGIVAIRPVKTRKNNTVLIRKISGVILWGQRIFIQQRPVSKVWGGLWEFPGGEVKETPMRELVDEEVHQIIMHDCGLPIKVSRQLATVQHQYTHHRVTLTCYLCELSESKTDPQLREAIQHRWVKQNELKDYAFPAGPRKIVDLLVRDNLLSIMW